MNLEDITKLVADLKQPKFRALQLFKWLQSGVDSFDEMTNIPLVLREQLSEISYIATVKALRKYVSQIDGTVKYLFEL
jgi:23S rRNA (adenine2503-C2)-methyltransferase